MHESLQPLQPSPFSTWGDPTHPSRPNTNVTSPRKPSRLPPASSLFFHYYAYVQWVIFDFIILLVAPCEVGKIIRCLCSKIIRTTVILMSPRAHGLGRRPTNASNSGDRDHDRGVCTENPGVLHILCPGGYYGEFVVNAIGFPSSLVFTLSFLGL